MRQSKSRAEPMQRPMKRVASLVLVAVFVGAGVWGYFYAQSRGNDPKYRFARVERGSLIAAVSATGNLNARSEEHTSELQSLAYLVCRLLLEKKKKKRKQHYRTRRQLRKLI